jgi:hypothetical protein
MHGPAAAAAVPDLPGVNRPAKKQERGNDYCQHFVDTGVRPQNFLRGEHQQWQRREGLIVQPVVGSNSSSKISQASHQCATSH